MTFAYIFACQSRCRHRDADRPIAKHRNFTASSSTYALAPVSCPDSQQTTDTSGLTIVPTSPTKVCTLPPPRVGSPSPRTCRRLQVIGYSPSTIQRHRFIVDGSIDAATATTRFNELDVWKTTHDDLFPAPLHSVWTDGDLRQPLAQSTAATMTRQRCNCVTGPAVPPPQPSLSQPYVATPDRVDRCSAPATTTTTPTSFSTFKPSPTTSPAKVKEQTSCAMMTLRPHRCGDDSVPTSTTKAPQNCRGMSLHLHVKHDVQCPSAAADNADRSQQAIS